MTRTGLIVALVTLAATSTFAEAPRALVVAYQGLGLEPEALDRLAEAVRTEVAAKGWTSPSPAEASKQQRAAVMCGEDAECLATLGQRSGARWVVAFGVARIGSNTVVSAILVDAPAGQRRQTFLEKLPALPPDLRALGRRMLDVLLTDVPLSPVVSPDVAPPTPVVLQPLEPPHRLRPFAITATVVTAVAAVTGTVVGVMALQNYERLPSVAIDQRGPADSRQRALNAGADVAVGVALAAATTATVLWVLDARSGGQP